MVLTNVEVKGSYLPMSFHTTSGTTLVMVEHGTMAASPTNGVDGTHALSTGLSVEDRSEDFGHDEKRVGCVSTNEGWGVN